MAKYSFVGCLFYSLSLMLIPAHGEIAPNPLVSVGKPVYSSSSTGLEHINDGVFGGWMEGDPGRSKAWYAWDISPSNPSWIAMKIGTGCSKLLIHSDTSSLRSHRPYDYTIETSADSTNGSDGTWKTVVTFVGENTLKFSFAPTSARNHVIDFEGQSWMRMTITSATKTKFDRHYGVVIDELSCFDATNGTPDSWIFIGDSITAEAYNHSFTDALHALSNANTPYMINCGIPGSSIYHWRDIIDKYLELYPDMKYWLIMLGTNDASTANRTANFEGYQTTMQLLIDRIKKAGHIPIIAKVPYNFKDGAYPVSAIQQFNKIIDTLNSTNELLPGPDFYTYFQSHPEMFRDKLHPNAEGAVAYRKLWVEALEPLYRAPASPR
ncbi:MAG: GDSL-type esterase/lipase family protein [Opitutaceae bacterium]